MKLLQKKQILFCIAILFALPILAGNGNTPPSTAKKIPLGGNSYLTSGQDRGKIRDSGFTRWNDPQDVYSTFFRVSQKGNLDLYLKYTATAASNIQVNCRNKKFSVSLTPGNEQTIHIGNVSSVDTGYIRVDFKGIERQGDTYAEASDLIVSGKATEGKMDYVDDFSFYWGRRGPSVHLGFPFPENETIEWFYNEVTAQPGYDPVGTYYMANGFAQGYFGIQVNSPTERRVLFSVWSPFETDNPKDIPETHKIKLLKKGEMVKTGEFGNEGSGGQSYMIYPWKTGTTYRFLTHIRPDGKGSTEYTAYFYTPDEGKWMLIASFSRPLTDTYYKGAHSFLESFNPSTGYLPRKALYGNQWARTSDGRWIEITNKVRFTADETGRKQARMDYKGGVEKNQFYLQNCGFLNDYTNIGTLFSRSENKTPPAIDFNQLP